MKIIEGIIILMLLPVFVFCMGKAPDPDEWLVEQRELGGFRLDKPSNPRVKEAAKFAVETLAGEISKKVELIKVHKVYSQLVSGMNYRMLMELKVDGNKEYWILQVYWDLQDNKKLTEKEPWEGN
ncbi:MAG: hypothetical protein JXA60_08215 [Candidatus Coatesbacteria bacterium]|nr:hypothetical protein [Candidatus Coatesbacteria bacterium]